MVPSKFEKTADGKAGTRNSCRRRVHESSDRRGLGILQVTLHDLATLVGFKKAGGQGFREGRGVRGRELGVPEISSAADVADFRQIWSGDGTSDLPQTRSLIATLPLALLSLSIQLILRCSTLCWLPSAGPAWLASSMWRPVPFPAKSSAIKLRITVSPRSSIASICFCEGR